MHANFTRRSFLARTALSAAAVALPVRAGSASSAGAEFWAGEGTADITPPLGIEMAGFHRQPGNERRIQGIRKPTAVRAIVMRLGETQLALVSVDIIGFSQEMAARVQQRVTERTGIPAGHVRLCATHSHSTPTFCYLRQWGAIPQEYMASVEDALVRAVEIAQADLAPADLYVGKSRAPGASNNRTTKQWKTDEQFDSSSSDDQRWLDTAVHTLRFTRGGGKHDLLWYHFSAHPVCYQDDLAGPDWPGLVDDMIRQKFGITPSFLQGHCGDVNAGDVDHWIGTAENTAGPVVRAIEQAVESARHVRVDELQVASRPFALPLDMELFARWIDEYRRDPSQCQSGVWVDAPFAEDWFRAAVERDPTARTLPTPLSAVRLGDVGLVFHSSELYSSYGLMIRRDSPLPDTLVVGYADDVVGYLPDPTAFEAGEYSAITVPKILDFPPFTRTAARELSAAATAMLRELV
jgi:neutral ceramidase